MRGRDQTALSQSSKVPAVTLGFWIIKIAATTLGETGGDTVSMTMNLGYLTGTAIFLAALAVLVACQIMASRFHPVLYWATIVASTTAGTTMADFADRSLGIGYAGGSSILLVAVLAMLGLWYWSERSVSVETVSRPRVELFYWATITLSQTLGTALGDWIADSAGLGYTAGSLVFGAALVAVARPIIGRASLVSCCSGPRSFSPGRLARPWVICWTSLWIMEDWRSVVPSPRQSSQA